MEDTQTTAPAETTPQPLPQLAMLRPDLEALPRLQLPPGVRIRTFRPGDEPVWAAIMEGILGSDWTPEKVREKLTGRPQFDPEGLFFALLNGQPAGSACAWKPSPEERIRGNVHMVAVIPEARGLGLGKLLTLKVLLYMRQRGLREADLVTDDFRIPAIRAYLSLGFRPVHTHESHAARWEAVMRQIAEASKTP